MWQGWSSHDLIVYLGIKSRRGGEFWVDVIMKISGNFTIFLIVPLYKPICCCSTSWQIMTWEMRIQLGHTFSNFWPSNRYMYGTSLNLVVNGKHTKKVRISASQVSWRLIYSSSILNASIDIFLGTNKSSFAAQTLNSLIQKNPSRIS